jgi:WD40 repeat protein
VSTSHLTPVEGLERFADAASTPPAAPYRSLKPFRFADAGILAAREVEIERLVRLITMYRGVLLYGESGAGKTSVVNAGVLPRLIGDGFWPHRVRVQPRPGQEFVLEPIATSDSDGDRFLPSAFEGAGESGQSVLDVAAFGSAVIDATAHGSILLVFDQFEELVTLFPEASRLGDAQRAVLGAIVGLLRKRDVPVKMLFSFREDYLANLKPLLEEQPELAHQSLRLVPPPLDRGEEIIRAPFERFPGAFGRELSSELAERIARLLAERSDRADLNLSELQIVCDRLWRSDDPDELLQRRGIEGLLEDHLSDALRALSPSIRTAAVALLSQMVTPRGTRNVVAAHDLVQRAHDEEGVKPQLLEEAVRRLETESQLIRRERRHDVDLYELTSEFLIPWISARREELRRRRERRRLFVLGSITALICLVAAVVAVLAVSAINQKNRAVQQTNRAAYLGLASRAQALLPSRPDVALLLALQAYLARPSGAPSVLAKSSLLAALESVKSSGVEAILHGPTDAVTSVAFNPVTHTLASASGDGTIRLWNIQTRRQTSELDVSPQGVSTMAFSPDGRILAAALETGEIELWSGRSRNALTVPNPDRSAVTALAFSRQGRYVAASDFAGAIRVWAISGNTLGSPTTLSLNDHAPVRSIAFAPDSRSLAAGDSHGTVTLWVLANRQPQEHVQCGNQVYALAFAPSGLLWAGGLRNSPCLINFAGTPSVVPLGAPGPAIRAIAISPNGRLVALARDDDRIQIFDAAHRQPLRLLVGHTGIVTTVAFSADGQALASGSTDRTVRLWNPRIGPAFGQVAASGRDWIPLRSVDTIALSRDGRSLAAGSDQGGQSAIDIWSVTSDGAASPVTQISGLHSGVREVAISPDGRLLVSAMGDGTVQLWALSAGKGAPRVLQQRQGPGKPAFALFSPTSDTVAFSGPGGTLSVWDASGYRRLGANSGGVYALAFNRDGSELAAGGENPTIAVWNVTSDKKVGPLIGHTDSVFGLAFAPRGDTLASGSGDDTVRLWDVATKKRVRLPLTGHTAYVRTVAFSPDGRTLASGGKDDSIRLWDVATASELGQPLGVNQRSIESVVFAPNGNFLVSGGYDGEVRIWPGILLPSRVASLRSEVCGLVGDGLRSKEERQYAPGLPRTDPCR